MPEKAEQQSGIIDRLFLEHPAEMGETYTGHLLFTLKTGGYLLVTFAALVFHGLVPRFHQTTASDRIVRLSDIIRQRNNNHNGSAKE